MNYKPARRSSARAPARPAKRAAKSGEKLTPQAIAAIVLAVLILLAAIAGIVTAIVLKSKQNDARLKAAYNGRTYSADAGGLVFLPGSEITVSAKGETEFSVLAVGDKKNDFTIRLNEETFLWSALDGEDFTDGFDIEETETGCKISFEGLEEVISASMYAPAVITGDVPEKDLFKLVIQCGKETLELGFRIALTASVLPNPPHLIF